MSYILDALQRADAERERGAVPGLHARQTLALATPARTAPVNRTALALAGAVACGAVAGGLWLWRVPVASDTLPRTPPVAATDTAPAAPPVTPPAAVVSGPLAPPAMPDRVATTLSPDVLAAPVARPAGTPASSAVPLLAELPDEMRRQIPALAISGAVYSDNPAQRLLLINGQVLAQGSAVTADVRLEEIREHHAVLNFKGTRFRVAH